MKSSILSSILGIVLCLVTLVARGQESGKLADALAKELEGMLKDDVQDCKALNPPYFQARMLETSDQFPPHLLDNMFLHRSRHNCLVYKCVKGRPCKPPPSISILPNLAQRFYGDLEALQDCWEDPQCPTTRASTLSEALKDAVFVLLRDYGSRDPKLALELLDQVTIAIGPAEVVNRCAQVVKSGRLSPEQAESVLRAMVEYVAANGIDQDTAIHLTELLEQLRTAENLTAESRAKLLSAVSKVLKAWLETQNVSDLDMLMEDLGSNEQLERLLVLVRAARALSDKEQTQALARAVELIVSTHPELKEAIPGSFDKAPMDKKLAALARLMNGAQLAELNRLREAAAAWMMIHSSRRPLKVLVVRKLAKACSGELCAAKQAMADEFVEQMRGNSPQSAEEVEVPARTTNEIIAFGLKALGPIVQPGVKDETACGPKAYAGLCHYPYVGVYVLEDAAPPQGEKVCQKVSYVARSVDAKVKQGATLAVCAVDEADAMSKARDLAVDALRASSVDNYVKVWGKDAESMAASRPVESTEQAPHWWRDSWVRPALWAGSVAALVIGGYVSNKMPESSAGDWSWGAGLGMSAGALGLEIASW